MVGNKIKYTCKNCGWITSIRNEWADLKPKRCMNKKCNTSFQKSPESLIIEMPQEVVAEKKSQKKGKKNETEDSNS